MDMLSHPLSQSLCKLFITRYLEARGVEPLYPRRFISATQARAVRSGPQPVVVGFAENP
jgi:hypothetical protein